MTRSVTRATIAAALLLLARRSGAGLLDSPAPPFDGGAGKVVYRMGPVHYDPGSADTIVSCTSLADGPVQVAFEIFDGHDQATGIPARAALPAGGAVTFATSAGAGEPNAVIVLGLSPTEDGKARVSATSAKLSCTAKHRIRSADASTRESALELIKRVAQGD